MPKVPIFYLPHPNKTSLLYLRYTRSIGGYFVYNPGPWIMDSTENMVQSNMALLNTFWQTQFQLLENGEPDFKNYQLPLARIKKVMKTDEDVRPMVHHSNILNPYIFR